MLAIFSRVSVHEASHAVAHLLWGATNVSARIRTDGNGIVNGEPTSPIGCVVGLLAAPIAELMVMEANPARRFTLAHGSDIVRAASEIKAIPGLSNRAAAIMSACTVWENYGLIERVAGVLRNSGEITDTEVRILCGAPN